MSCDDADGKTKSASRPTFLEFDESMSTLCLGDVGLSGTLAGVKEAAAGESFDGSVELLVVAEPRDEAEKNGS